MHSAEVVCRGTGGQIIGRCLEISSKRLSGNCMMTPKTLGADRSEQRKTRKSEQRKTRKAAPNALKACSSLAYPM